MIGISGLTLFSIGFSNGSGEAFTAVFCSSTFSASDSSTFVSPTSCRGGDNSAVLSSSLASSAAISETVSGSATSTSPFSSTSAIANASGASFGALIERRITSQTAAFVSPIFLSSVSKVSSNFSLVKTSANSSVSIFSTKLSVARQTVSLSSSTPEATLAKSSFLTFSALAT